MVEEAEEVEDQEEENKGSSQPIIKIIVVVVLLTLLLSGGVVGLTLYLTKDKGAGIEADVDVDEQNEAAEVMEEKMTGPTLYHSLDPKFTVTFREQKEARFMQFSLQAMMRDKEIVEQLTLHMPAIRSGLLLLFSNQEFENVSTQEGKEQLLVEITEDINRTLKKVTGRSGIETVYFDTFLIQ